MYTPNKILRYVKNSISQIFSDSSAEECVDSASDNLTVKKVDYEALKNEHFNQTEIIKKLTRKNEENLSLIQDYEKTFSMVLQKDLIDFGARGRRDNSYSYRKMEDEIERLKCSEQRLKSHIKALKKELVVEESKNKATLEDFKDNIRLLKAENDSLSGNIRSLVRKIEELEFRSKESQIEIEIKCRELAEVIEFARMLMKQ